MYIRGWTNRNNFVTVTLYSTRQDESTYDPHLTSNVHVFLQNTSYRAKPFKLLASLFLQVEQHWFEKRDYLHSLAIRAIVFNIRLFSTWWLHALPRGQNSSTYILQKYSSCIFLRINFTYRPIYLVLSFLYYNLCNTVSGNITGSKHICKLKIIWEITTQNMKEISFCYYLREKRKRKVECT